MPDHALTELVSAELALADAAASADLRQFRFDLGRLRGDALRQTGRFAEAEAAYNRVLAERPGALPVLMAVAACYRQTGQIDRAVAAMEEANRLHPDEPAVAYALARFCIVSGEHGRAIGWLGRAVRLCPEIGPDAEADPDFAPLRDDRHFRRIVEAAAARAA